MKSVRGNNHVKGGSRMSHRNVMFWANVTAYIERLVDVQYESERAIKAAALKYHLSEKEIRDHCDLNNDIKHS